MTSNASQPRYFQNTDLAEFTTAQGSKILGATAGDLSGNSICVGDINGDGIADLIIGAPNASPNSKSGAGISYVIFGKPTGFGDIDLANLDPTQGFKIFGATAGDLTGNSISAGDINGDGLVDIIIGAPYADPNSRTSAGITYVIFGKASGFTDIDLANLDATQGFKILGSFSYDNSGYAVAYVDDFNGDGYGDIVIGARYATYNTRSAGVSYVIFGKASGFSDIDLRSLTLTQGFRIIGAARDDNSGESVASIGDFNNDGYSDILIGSPYASPNSRSEAGTSYVIFGKASGFSDIDLASLTSTQGFKIIGAAKDDWSGKSLGSASDFNGDGYSDLIIGVSYTYANSRANAGTSYIIFGKASGFSDIDLASLTSAQGFKIIGAARNHYSGWNVGSVGDLNGDGYGDVIIGAQVVQALQSDPSSRTNAGVSYIVFGKGSGFTDIDLANLDITQGFKIIGAASNDYSGGSASFGDFDGDGNIDIVIGAFGASPSSKTKAGISYVIFDTVGTFSPTNIPTKIPTPIPTTFNMLSSSPTSQPSVKPSSSPSLLPSNIGSPTSQPSIKPSSSPSLLPSNIGSPTSQPSIKSSSSPSLLPSNIGSPTSQPSIKSSSSPSLLPSNVPNLTSTNTISPTTMSTTITPTSSTTFTSTLLTSPTLNPTEYPTITSGGNTINSSDKASILSIIGIVVGSLSGTCIFGYATYKCYGFRSTSGVKIAADDQENQISLSKYSPANPRALFCIDSDPASLYFQNEALDLFVYHLTHFFKEDVAKNIESISESLSQLVIKDSGDKVIIIPRDQDLLRNNIQSDSYELSILSLLNAKQILQKLPFLHYMAQSSIEFLGYNITLPDPSDHRALLVSLDLVLGSIAAQYFEDASVMNAIFISTASSISFGIRLASYDYLRSQVISDEPIEFGQQCGVTIAAYSLPSVVNYAFAKAFLPNSEMQFDILSTTSFGVAKCYYNYKAAYDIESSALNTVVPYIADAVAVWVLRDYIAFDTSSVASLTAGIKNTISVVSTVYAAHCISDVMIDLIPQDVREYIDTSLSYLTEVATGGIDDLYYNFMDAN